MSLERQDLFSPASSSIITRILPLLFPQALKLNDELEFLKRKHRLVAAGQKAIFPHSKHFEKLFELVGDKKTWSPKHVPGHGMINEFDETIELDAAKATKFRSGVGVLLYLAHDLIECQFVIRGLARHMSN